MNNDNYIFSEDSITTQLSEMKEDYLAHYGTPRHSGRYPWGSGENPYQHEPGMYGGKPRNVASTNWGSSAHEFKNAEELYNYIRDKEKAGTSRADLAKELELPTRELNLQYRIATHMVKSKMAAEIQELREKNMPYRDIAAKLDIPEATVRSLINKGSSDRRDAAVNAAEILKKEIAEKGMLDVGKGNEAYLDISRDKLEEALRYLEYEGYGVYPMGVSTGPKRQSNTIILCQPGVPHKYVYDHQGEIQTIGEYRSPDNGKTIKPAQRPTSLDSKRIYVRYAEEGGGDREGTIEIRPGVPDLTLGNSHYAQARVLVDGTHYMKGMAFYNEDIPDGYDVVYNTKKKQGTEFGDVFKKAKKDDPDNPFGAYITAKGQNDYIDEKTGETKLSPINMLKQEGDWNEQSRSVASQMLGKQKVSTIKTQLDITYKNIDAEYQDILAIDNPVIRRHYLLDFARTCDSKSVDMKAAAFPRQRTQVILPLDKIGENEIYAPNYKDGEEVILIRYPHGGIFEIPTLKVNNKFKQGKQIIGNAQDAVGISPKTASVLSGADFDGDTVLVIPTAGHDFQTMKPLDGLKGFDTKMYNVDDKIKEFEKKYPGVTDLKTKEYNDAFKKEYGINLVTKEYGYKQMGIVSNLITDMTIQGATADELARATRHSMVMIDSYKHQLNYKQSEKDNDIKSLIKKYQKHKDDDKAGGASTLLSKSTGEIDIPERKGSGYIDRETGEIIFKNSGRMYYDKKGNLKEATQKAKRGAVTKDMYELSSGTDVENAYADYSNKLKALANKARLEYLATEVPKKDKAAAELYSKEVESLDKKLEAVIKNKPLERKANAIANAEVKRAAEMDPDLDKKDLQKIRTIALNKARQQVGSASQHITVTDAEWNAIQNNAISSSKLVSILEATDADDLRKRSMPNTNSISPAKVSRIKALYKMGYTQADIADQMGVSTNTVNKAVNGDL